MSWKKFTQHYLSIDELDFALDISRIDFGDDFLAEMEPKIQSAFEAMQELEAGAIANPDEGRMVGHYWLRNANPHFPALRSDPMAGSGGSRQKEIPSSS
jgi:glucose-6-phosphate isomerase